MASAPVKRRHRGEDRLAEHTQRKKRKETARSESYEHRSHSKSKKKKRSRSSSTDGKKGSLRVRSVSELASLVESGAIRVPKNLEYYIEDRTQLLDQVFTILSPDDIKGMLPDILKELKMKQVKQLCFDQLRRMSCEELHCAIKVKDSDKDTDLNSTLMQLLKQAKDTTDSPAASEMATKIKAEERSSISVTGGEILSTETHENPLADSGRQFKSESEDEIVIHVSDVSDEDSVNVNVRSPLLDKEAALRCTEDQHSQSQEESVKIGPKQTATPAAVHCSEINQAKDFAIAEEDSHYSGSGDDGSSSEDGDGLNWASSSNSDVSLVLEIELRKRALESMKTKPVLQDTEEDYYMDDQSAVQNKNDEYNKVDDADIAMQCDTETVEDLKVSKTPCITVRVNPSASKECILDPGGMLEADLRQKALQSMFAKRKLPQDM